MSVSLVLVPLAIAAVAAWQASHAETDAEGRVVTHVATRMRRVDLLQEALAETGATVRMEDKVLVADWTGVQARFEQGADGIWGAHLTGEVDEQRAVEIVTSVDIAYGKAVQRAVLEKLRRQASTANLTVESEKVEQDQSVTMVLAVNGTGG